MRRTAALIAGGGPAGCAAAITLARAGMRPLLIERAAMPSDALCGGFLSWRTVAALAVLGVDTEALGGARIERLRIVVGTRTAEARLPAPAMGLSRRALDTALRARAEAAGAEIERGVAIAAFEGDAMPAVRLRGGTVIAADAMIHATGKHDLRGLVRPRPGADEDRMVGLRIRLPASRALGATLRGAIEMHLVRDGYAGLLLQEDGSANLCMAVRGSRLAEAGSAARLIAALCEESPLLGERVPPLHAATIDAVAQIPYGWRARTTGPGVFRAGDQAGVIASLAGEGIGIALATGTAAANAVVRGDSSDAFQRANARRLARPMGIARLLAALAERRSGARMLVEAIARMPALAGFGARLTRVPGTSGQAPPG